MRGARSAATARPPTPGRWNGFRGPEGLSRRPSTRARPAGPSEATPARRPRAAGRRSADSRKPATERSRTASPLPVSRSGPGSRSAASGSAPSSVRRHGHTPTTSGTGFPGIDLIGGGEDVQTVSPSRDFIAATRRGADPRRRHHGHARSLDPGADPLIPGRRRARDPPAPAPRSPETVRLPPRSRAAFPLDRTPPAL